MKLHMPITKEKVKNHFHYNLWKYALLVVLCVFGWNLLYTTTRYQVPDALKVEFYVDGYETTETREAMNALMERIHREVMPDMEAVTYTILGQDDTYGQMQLTVWVSAGQGDVYLLLQDRFESLAENGALMNLQPYIDSGALYVEGIDLSRGRVRDEETGEKKQYGIPADELVGLQDCGVITQGATLSILAGCGNEEYAILFLNELLTTMR